MKITTALVLAVLPMAALAQEERQVKFAERGVEVSAFEWRPVTLDEEEREIFETRSDEPETALDYYLALPETYFQRVEDSPERRVTFIERETLSDQYLHAEYTIPQVDAGAFSVTIRVFHKDWEPLVAIRHRGDSKVIYEHRGEEPADYLRISMGRPEFWRFREKKWIAESGEILPSLSKEDILDRYRNHYQAHLRQPTQQKYISLGYTLPQTGKVIQVTGRENFMSPRKNYVWAEYEYDWKHFTRKKIPDADE